jgi:crotonobetainyl-CoA:carnitine CoA-transferase CaiB-like acyl-CoA transferase
VFLESTPRGYLASQGITYERLSAVNPALIWSRVMPFGDDGPWAGYKASDLVHLALGGVMMCTGYDPHPLTKEYETPPIAPQMFQA